VGPIPPRVAFWEATHSEKGRRPGEGETTESIGGTSPGGGIGSRKGLALLRDSGQRASILPRRETSLGSGRKTMRRPGTQPVSMKKPGEGKWKEAEATRSRDPESNST